MKTPALGPPNLNPYRSSLAVTPDRAGLIRASLPLVSRFVRRQPDPAAFAAAMRRAGVRDVLDAASIISIVMDFDGDGDMAIRAARALRRR